LKKAVILLKVSVNKPKYLEIINISKNPATLILWMSDLFFPFEIKYENKYAYAVTSIISIEAFKS
jgi:hypothetical protein